MTAGVSMYFRDNRIHVRKGTIAELGNPRYVHLHVNEKKKQLFIQPCEKDKDSFRIYYKADEGSNEENPMRCYLNAKRILDYLSRLIGVDRYSESLRFDGELMEEDNVLFIDLTSYKVIPY